MEVKTNHEINERRWVLHQNKVHSICKYCEKRKQIKAENNEYDK